MDVINRLKGSGVKHKTLKQMDTAFKTVGDDSMMVWRIADEGHLDSYFSRLPEMEQSDLLRPYNYDKERYYGITAWTHRSGVTKESPWVSTAAHLAPLSRTRDRFLRERAVLKSDSLYLLNVPKNLTMGMSGTFELEVLVKAMYTPLNPYVITKLPNIFRRF